jgi:hypothetical protein
MTIKERRQLGGNSEKTAWHNNGCPYLDGMDLLIKDGLYESQSEIVKDALRRLFNHYEIQCIRDACSNCP